MLIELWSFRLELKYGLKCMNQYLDSVVEYLVDDDTDTEGVWCGDCHICIVGKLLNMEPSIELYDRSITLTDLELEDI